MNPVAEQQEIVRRMEELFALAIGLMSGDKACGQMEKLTLLAKAFRGELVPQDPNDEPASALLGRIREDGSTRQKTASSGNRQAKTKA
jgi:type I restriction enzyme S subunit